MTTHPTHPHLPRGPAPAFCIIVAFCSAKRWPTRSEVLRNLSTQRITQPSSLEWSDLVVKSFTQSSKHFCTRFEYIYASGWLAGRPGKNSRRGAWKGDGQKRRRSSEWYAAPTIDQTHVHEFLHLLPLHAVLQLPLLIGVEAYVRPTVSWRPKKAAQAGHVGKRGNSLVHGDGVLYLAWRSRFAVSPGVCGQKPLDVDVNCLRCLAGTSRWSSFRGFPGVYFRSREVQSTQLLGCCEPITCPQVETGAKQNHLAIRKVQSTATQQPRSQCRKSRRLDYPHICRTRLSSQPLALPSWPYHHGTERSNRPRAAHSHTSSACWSLGLGNFSRSPDVCSLSTLQPLDPDSAPLLLPHLYSSACAQYSCVPRICSVHLDPVPAAPLIQAAATQSPGVVASLTYESDRTIASSTPIAPQPNHFLTCLDAHRKHTVHYKILPLPLDARGSLLPHQLWLSGGSGCTNSIIPRSTISDEWIRKRFSKSLF
jgi:hypothetical protein